MAARTNQACMDDLPNEVLVRVFGFLDGASIGRCARVCRRWFANTSIIFNCSGAWKLICANEIDPDVLSELAGGKQRSGSDSVDWLAVYKWWHCASNIRHRKHTTRTFDVIGENPVTCVRVTGSAVVTCHGAGTVALWNLEGFCRNITTHQAPVTDLAFVDDVAGDGSYADKDATYAHRLVATTSYDHSVQISALCRSDKFRTLTQYYGHGALKVTYSDGFLAVMLKLGGIHGYEVVVRGDRGSLRPLWVRPHEGSPQKWMGFGGGTLKVLEAGSRLLEICPDTGRESRRDVRFRTPDGRPCTDAFFPAHAVIQRADVIITNTASQNICISTDGSTFVRHRTSLVIGEVMQTALHGGILAVALHHGWLNLYHAPSSSALTSLDFGAPCWSKKLSDGPLTSLAIAHDACGAPLVVAAKFDTVYVLRWDV